jgi:hypothetical protein
MATIQGIFSVCNYGFLYHQMSTHNYGCTFIGQCSKTNEKEALIWLTHPGNGVVASCGFYIGVHYSSAECAIQRGRERWLLVTCWG